MSLTDQQWCPTSVQVTALQARGLRVKGKSGTNDAYAVLQVGKEKFQTSVVEKSVTPVWKEEATFDLPQLLRGGGGGGSERSTLQVQVLHRALVGPDKLLGQAVINLPQLSEDTTRNKTEWFRLLDKQGKPDKDRGEVLLDIQFMRNNMTASMFDLSTAGKSRSRLGKFKDKVRGKKKELDSSSGLAPSLTQVMTDSEEEANGDGEEVAKKDGKSKKLKVKSLFSSKTNLQKTMSQSMSVLPAKNSSLSGSQSSGLNIDPTEGKKKFKFKIHKRSGSSDSKDLSVGNQKRSSVEQTNMCINGSHVYCEEPQPRTSRAGSNFSLASSGHGSMEDVPDTSSPSLDSLRAVRQYSPWMEEEEEEEDDDEEKGENNQEIENQQSREDVTKMEEERRKKEEQEILKRQEELKMIIQRKEEKLAEEEKIKEEELQRLAEEKRLEKQEQKKLEEEEKRREEEKIKKEKDRKAHEEEERQREEELKLAEIMRIEEERRCEELRRQKEEEERIEEMRRKEEMTRRQKEEEEMRAEQEKAEREQEERRRKEEEEEKEILRRQEEERRKEEEEEILRRQEEERRKEEEEEILRRQEEERRKEEEEEILRRQEEERRKEEEEEILRRQEEERRKEEDMQKEYERRKREEEMKKKEEEERARKQKEAEKMKRQQEERKRKEEEEMIRKQEELERELEKERLRVEEEERKAEEERLEREKEERIRLEEEIQRKEEEKRQREKMRREEERRLKELEMLRQEEEEKIRQEEQEKRRIEEKMKQEDEAERARKEIEENERLAQLRKLEEQEKRQIEEEEKLRRDKLRKEEEKRKLKEENLANGRAAELISTNPFGEDFSLNPFEDDPNFSSEAQSRTVKGETVKQRCDPALVSEGSRMVSSEMDPIRNQREKRKAPQPPESGQGGRRIQKAQDAAELQMTKQNPDGDGKTVSLVSPCLTTIPLQNKSLTDLKNTQSSTPTSEVTGKRPAPSRPQPIAKDSSELKKIKSARNIPHVGSTAKEHVQPILCSNPFENENELSDQEDSSASGPVCWPPASTQTADRDAASQVKLKSSKMAPAPVPPAKSDANGGHKVINKGLNDASDQQQESTGHLHVNNGPNADSQCIKTSERPPGSRRLLPVKPLNPSDQPSTSLFQEDANSPGIGCELQTKNKVPDTVMTGPFSQLTREELVCLVLKQETHLLEKQRKISELEQYIDNLLVRVIEEQPSILMSLSAAPKKVA